MKKTGNKRIFLAILLSGIAAYCLAPRPPLAKTAEKIEASGALETELAPSIKVTPAQNNEFQPLSFQELDYYQYPVNPDGSPGKLKDGTPSSIPDQVKKLDRKRIKLSGFMLPLSTQGEKTTDFILMKNQLLCCFGQEPKLNEWAIVIMREPITPVSDKLVTVSGTFLVGEVIEDGIVVCLYRVAGEKLEIE